MSFVYVNAITVDDAHSSGGVIMPIVLPMTDDLRPDMERKLLTERALPLAAALNHR